jgi:hypothetical protein
MLYHGCPVTPLSELRRLTGRRFCVSHIEPTQAPHATAMGAVLMLDNGAFTHWTKGRRADWPRFYAWAETWLAANPENWAVVPDVITGTAEDNDALIAQWPHGDRGAPVWHMHEPIARLLRLCERWPRVCVGSSGSYAVVGTPRWHTRMVQAWNAIGEGTPPRLHMMRGLSLSGGPYPFHSADSADIGRNHAGSHRRARTDVVVMAERWEARAARTARRWTRQLEQQELIA